MFNKLFSENLVVYELMKNTIETDRSHMTI
jgi:hypothetical protein